MTSVYKQSDKGNLNVDLIDEFLRHGHKVDVVTPIERKYKKQTEIYTDENLMVIRFKSLNFRGKVNLIEKGISTLSLGYQYKYVLNKYLKDRKYDIAIYTTLPITYSPVIKELKNKYGTYCYLLHKDFFPQSAVDLGILNKSSLPYKLFRKIEKGLYKRSDTIGVMSEKNIDFILADNPYIDKSKVEICPNSINPMDITIIKRMKEDRDKIRNQYGIPLNNIVYVYGGNISRAQGIDYIIEIVKGFKKCNNSFLLFVGSGNEIEKLNEAIESSGSKNVKVINYLEKDKFDQLVAACDVGLVFLDNRFTIANIPSRTLAHINMYQPILAATDEFTDFKNIVEENEIGLWNSSNDIKTFFENVDSLTNNETLRNKLGFNARNYLINECNTEKSYKIIMSHFKQVERGK